MPLQEIKHRCTGAVIYSCKAETFRECAERAVKEKVSLRGADMRGANMRGANMSGVDMDFSCWPLSCKSTRVVASDRLFAQLFFHLTRINVSKSSGGVRESMDALRAMAASDLYCEYRSDVGNPVYEQ